MSGIPFILGVACIYILPAVALSFASRPQATEVLERIAWIGVWAVLVMPTLLFILTKSGMPFLPRYQFIAAGIMSLGGMTTYILRKKYGRPQV